MRLEPDGEASSTVDSAGPPRASRSPLSALNGPLQRVGILTGAQGDLRAFFAELKALEEVAYELAEAVTREVDGGHMVNKLTSDRRRLVANAHRLGRIVVLARVAEQEMPQLFRRRNHLRRGDPQLLGMFLDEDQDAIGDPSGVRQVERDVEVRHARGRIMPRL